MFATSVEKYFRTPHSTRKNVSNRGGENDEHQRRMRQPRFVAQVVVVTAVDPEVRCPYVLAAVAIRTATSLDDLLPSIEAIYLLLQTRRTRRSNAATEM